MKRTCDLIIPALDEEPNVHPLFDALDQLPPGLIRRVVLADNGSRDDTRTLAAQRGAVVVHEPQRGYGAACLAALDSIAQHDPPDIVAFCDADLSDDPAQLPKLIAPVAAGAADLAIGCRPAMAEPGSLNSVQRFGNALACGLMRLFTGVAYRDLGPMRVVSWNALTRLAMRDQSWGWTVEMQMKAALMHMLVAQIDVPYRNRHRGRSKISGTLRGGTAAGTKIIATLLTLWWRRRELRAAGADSSSQLSAD